MKPGRVNPGRTDSGPTSPGAGRRLPGGEGPEFASPWRTESTRRVYENPWITVREDAVVRPDGTPGIYGVVEAKLAVGVLAVTDAGEVVLVGQYRYPTRRYSWEIVAGGAERDEDAAHAAARELREEAGLAADRWDLLGEDVQLSNCFSDETARLYLARSLRDVPACPDPTEVLATERVPLPDAVRMAAEGQISDAMSVIALLRAGRLLP